MTPPTPPPATHVLLVTKEEIDRIARRTRKINGAPLGSFVEGPAVEILVAVIRAETGVDIPRTVVFRFGVVASPPATRLVPFD